MNFFYEYFIRPWFGLTFYKKAITQAIYQAAEQGHLESFKLLQSYLSPNELKAVIKVNDYKIINSAAQQGYVDILRTLLGPLNDSKKVKLLKADNYALIRNSCGKKSVQILRFF